MASLGASALHLDPDQRLGDFRQGLLILGAAGSIIVSLGWVATALDKRTSQLQQQGSAIDSVPSFHSAPPLRKPGSGVPWLGVGMVVILVEIIFLFFISKGHWTWWPLETDFYDLQANAFLNGQLALPIDPVPELINLEDPYNPSARQGIPYPFDASYYRGEYYIYWGPAPALLLSGWKAITGASVGDQVVAFLAVNIVFLFSSLILLELKRRFAPGLQASLLIGGVALVGTAHPLLWTLSWPGIYQAAIASGQAFLIAGLYVGLPSLVGDKMPHWKYLVTGLFWALAIACRITLLLPVGFLVLWAAWQQVDLRHMRSLQIRALVTPVLLSAPLLAGLILLAAYNQARFDDPFETGIRYQLSTLDYRPIVEDGELFDIRYFAPNALYQAIAPVRYSQTFPYVRPQFEEVSPISAVASFIRAPEAHYVYNSSGLLLAMPTIVFPLIFVGSRICLQQSTFPTTRPQGESAPDHNGLPMLERIIPVLLAAALIAAIPSLAYFWVANRFLLDYVPLLSIATAASAWYLYLLPSRRVLSRKYVSSLMYFLVGAGALTGFLLALTGPVSTFDDLNPELWSMLTQFFGSPGN